MTPFLTSLAFVVLAEMGDKTQLLAMAFASRYRWQTVLWAVFVATLCNHLIAVLVGCLLTNLIPLQSIKIAASASFILFGLWTVRGDELREEQERTGRSPFWTVGIAFFIAEMGDKTQLATCALATRFERILPIWLGTTAGMMLADALGIGVGIVLGKKIPERAIKGFAASAFIAFGLLGLYEVGPKNAVSPLLLGSGALVLCALVYVVTRRKKGKPPLLEPEHGVGAREKDPHSDHRPLKPNV